MARYDKYDPISGGFRAPLESAVTSSDVGTPIAVGLNGSGRVIPAADGATVRGVFVADKPFAAGDIADVMTDGEIVEFEGETVTAGDPAAPGTDYYGTAAGEITTTHEGNTPIGFTVEASRLVVRVGRVDEVGGA